MIDFHSHILPGMDDGSRSSEESLRMLTALKEQGINTVALTSHFYAKHEDPHRFLERRAHCFSHLQKQMTEDLPQVRLGAEVLYYNGVSHMSNLSQLCLEGTRLLLLEMPFSRWSDYTVSEVLDLHNSGEVVVMLAHIERYLAWQKEKVWDQLLQNGVLMQSNAEFFFTPMVRRKAVHMLEQNRIHCLGTDCHNMTTRGVHMDSALEVIEKHLGKESAERLKQQSEMLLRECSL